MPIENGITPSVTDVRGETSLQEPIESNWNLVCLVSLVFLLRIPGATGSIDFAGHSRIITPEVTNAKKNLSTIKNQESAHPWLSRPDADQERTQGH